MKKLAHECIELFNNGLFQVIDPGPMHAPIHNLSLSRDENLDLILETDVDPDGRSTAVEQLPGTVRLATEKVKLISPAGIHGELQGVIPFSLTKSFGPGMPKPNKENAKVHRVQLIFGNVEKAVYAIDWLENLPSSPFLWPDGISTRTVTTTQWDIGRDEKALTIIRSGESFNGANSAARLTVGEISFYICALKPEPTDKGIYPGCIIYEGMPEKAMRERIKTALSFALGTYLVDLGYSLYDEHWVMVATIARKAYSLGRRAFEMGPSQLAPAGTKYQYELDRNALNQMVCAFVAKYDELDLGNLSWAYWHACAATVHNAPAQFGCAIEALQRAYVRANTNTVSNAIVPENQWRELRDSLAAMIAQTDISEGAKKAIKAKIYHANKPDQRALLKSILDDIGIDLSDDESKAWNRRNKAAHGVPIAKGDELNAIREMKLLKGLFHRMLLRMSGATDRYIDYATLGFPVRPLKTPPANLVAAP